MPWERAERGTDREGQPVLLFRRDPYLGVCGYGHWTGAIAEAIRLASEFVRSHLTTLSLSQTYLIFIPTTAPCGSTSSSFS